MRNVAVMLLNLKLWQKVLLVIVIAGAASGIYIAFGGSGGSTAAANLETQTYTVRAGNLTSTIYASGSLVYSTSQQLTFDAAGTVETVSVETYDTVAKGDVLARLDSVSIESMDEAVARARIDLRDAQEGFEEASNPYSDSDIANATIAVNQAQKQLEDAQARVVIQIANAEYAVTKACEKSNDSLVQYMNGQIDFDEYQQALRDYETKKLDLEMVKLNAENSVSDAQKKLKSAQDSLEEMLKGPDPLEVALKQSQLATAQAALDDALEKLELAKEGYPVIAPFDGVVASVNVQPGDEVNANTIAIELVDSSAIELSARVDEIDVAQLKPGQAAMITVDAIPNTTFFGNVSGISASAQSQSGVVSYPITVSLVNRQGTRLLEGMSATATMQVQLASDVLLVPSSAVTGAGNIAIVQVMVNGQPEPRRVMLGASDGVRTEVKNGLNEGDLVVLEASSSGTSTSNTGENSFPGGIFPGGGFPGGGVFPGGGDFRDGGVFYNREGR